MKMTSQRKVERDRAKREAARTRTRPPTDANGNDVTDPDGTDDIDDLVARSLLGYDE